MGQFLICSSQWTRNTQWAKHAHPYAQAIWDNFSFVHRNGQEIHNGQNTPIHLDGVNIGSWLMWEGLMWSGGLTSEKEMTTKMSTIIGATAVNAFRDSVYKHYLSMADIERISQQCFNVVRVPFNHTILEGDSNPYVYKQSGWDLLDSLLQWCEENNVYVVLDLHSAPGGQNTLHLADPDPVDLWQSPTNKTRTVELWRAIANRYKNRGIIAAYDLLNEPNVWWWPDLINLYNDIIAAIRSVDNNHMIMLEGNQYAKDLSIFTSLPDSNICLHFHYYPTIGGPQNMNSYLSVSNSLNVPIWCGEWGEDNFNGLQDQLDTLTFPAYKVRGNAFWTWKTVQNLFSNPHYLYATNHPDWQNTMNWVSYNTPTVTAVQMQNGINSFIQNIKLQNCTTDTLVANLIYMCNITGTADYMMLNNTIVYPNPFSNSINVINTQEISNYELLNSTGISVWSGSNINNEDFSNLTSGIYFLKIKYGNSFVARKIIKM
jgi:hypothetical protein